MYAVYHIHMGHSDFAIFTWTKIFCGWSAHMFRIKILCIQGWSHSSTLASKF